VRVCQTGGTTLGKRSEFKRRPRDFYPTPYEAVLPLIPHLNGTRRFAEPCSGKGDLVRHLESFRLECIYSGDMHTGKNALARDSYGRGKYCIVTNPPHSRDVMHQLIEHFWDIAPTWLLIDLDWAANVHATPYLWRCTDMVVIGRVKWFANSKSAGKENYMWARFDGDHRGGPQFHNNRGGAAPE